MHIFNIIKKKMSNDEISQVYKYRQVRRGLLRNDICHSEAKIHQPIKIWQFLIVKEEVHKTRGTKPVIHILFWRFI